MRRALGLASRQSWFGAAAASVALHAAAVAAWVVLDDGRPSAQTEPGPIPIEIALAALPDPPPATAPAGAGEIAPLRPADAASAATPTSVAAIDPAAGGAPPPSADPTPAASPSDEAPAFAPTERATPSPAARRPPPPRPRSEARVAARAPATSTAPAASAAPATSADTPADATIGEAATAAAPGAAADGCLAALRVPTRVGIAAQGNAPPDYPETARERGIEGRVLLRAMVDATGRARSVTVIGSSRHAMLDEAARRAVAGWRFTPATIDGVAVDGTVDVPIVFRLSD